MTPPNRRQPEKSSSTGLSWDQAQLAPLVLVQGSEAVLVDRAVARLWDLARNLDPDVERTTIEAATYEVGQLSVLTSPSLFAEPRIVFLEAVQSTTDALIADGSDYAGHPETDTTVVFVHRGGVRGKKLLEALRAAGAVVVQCDPIKKDADKLSFVHEEFRRASKRITAGASRALVQAVGSDLRELAAACSQLIADSASTVDEASVERYYGGRVEVSAFKVADAAVAGQSAEAVSLLRHALATGADPVPLVAALALKLRTLAKVSTLRGGGDAKALSLAPWQIDKARRELSAWSPDGLAAAILAVARADAEVKGAGRDPVFAVERAVLTIAAQASR